MALMTTLGRVLAAGLAAMGSVVPSHAMAAGYPDKPVRMVVPFPPGGTTDIVARIVAQKMSDVWARQVVIDNRSGAGGSIGSDLVAKASPDGYTVLFGLQTTHAINPGVYKNLPFDPIKDFAPIANCVSGVNALVVNNDLGGINLRH